MAKAKQPKSLDVRKFINAELVRQQKTKYWLGKTVKELGGANRETVFRYLRGDRDTTGGVIGVMLTALGIKLTGPVDDGATADVSHAADRLPAKSKRRRPA